MVCVSEEVPFLSGKRGVCIMAWTMTYSCTLLRQVKKCLTLLAPFISIIGEMVTEISVM